MTCRRNTSCPSTHSVLPRATPRTLPRHRTLGPVPPRKWFQVYLTERAFTSAPQRRRDVPDLTPHMGPGGAGITGQDQTVHPTRCTLSGVRVREDERGVGTGYPTSLGSSTGCGPLGEETRERPWGFFPQLVSCVCRTWDGDRRTSGTGYSRERTVSSGRTLRH